MPNSVPSKAWDIHGIRAAAVIVAHLMVAMGFSTKFLRPKAELQPSPRVARLCKVGIKFRIWTHDNNPWPAHNLFMCSFYFCVSL